MFRTEAQSTQRFLKLWLPPLRVLCDLREKHSFEQRFFNAFSAPLSLAFVDSVRGIVSNRGFSTLFLLPLRVLCDLRESYNGVGGTKSFAQRHGGLRGF